MTAFYKFIKVVGGSFYRIFYRIKFVGQENLPQDGGYVICSNHTSMTDVPFIVMGCDRQVIFMAKEELFKNKIAGWFFKNMGAFAVKRGVSGTKALDTATEVVKKGNVLGIFPEGTRHFEGPPQKAKSGISVIVANTNATVVPVSIYHEGKIKLFDKVTVRYGKPISAEEIGMKDASRNELRRLSALLMDKITEQWELGY